MYLHCLHKQAYFNCSTILFLQHYNTVLIQTMTLTPTNFYICSYCAHMHTQMHPIFLLCKLKEGELIHILGCYPWDLKSIPLHSMLRWTPGLRGKDRHVYGCQWLTVRPHWIICLYSKRPPQLALLDALDWVGNFHNFLSSCKPPWGCISNRKNLGWWDLLRVLKLQDCEINQVDLMGQDKMSPESPAWGLHTRTHGSHTKKNVE